MIPRFDFGYHDSGDRSYPIIERGGPPHVVAWVPDHAMAQRIIDLLNTDHEARKAARTVKPRKAA